MGHTSVVWVVPWVPAASVRRKPAVYTALLLLAGLGRVALLGSAGRAAGCELRQLCISQ